MSGDTNHFPLCYFPQSLMLQIAQWVIEAEAIQAEEEKNRYMDENVPSLSVPGSMQELQV